MRRANLTVFLEGLVPVHLCALATALAGYFSLIDNTSLKSFVRASGTKPVSMSMLHSQYRVSSVVELFLITAKRLTCLVALLIFASYEHASDDLELRAKRKIVDSHNHFCC